MNPQVKAILAVLLLSSSLAHGSCGKVFSIETHGRTTTRSGTRGRVRRVPAARA